MRKKIGNILIVSLLVMPMAGCSTWEKLDKTEKGAVIGTGSGAVLGGASGSAGGALLGGAAGGVIGGVIGNEMEKEE